VERENAGQEGVRHLAVLRIDVGTFGEQLVYRAEPAAFRRKVEGGLPML
jgi:hypothetical protein